LLPHIAYLPKNQIAHARVRVCVHTHTYIHTHTPKMFLYGSLSSDLAILKNRQLSGV